MSDAIHRSTIHIGNLLYSVSCNTFMSSDSFAPFINSPDCGPISVDCTLEIISDAPRRSMRRPYIVPDRLFEADLTWGLYRREKAAAGMSTIMTVPAMKNGSRSRVFAEFDGDFKNGRVYTRRAEEHYFFYPFLEVLTIRLLADGKGALLHACCVDDSGAGYLFLGESGAGKSTMANLWDKEKGTTVLSDDRVLVSLNDCGLIAYGTPWHGTEKYAVNAGVPVKKIFFISHADKNTLSLVNGVTAASELVRNAFLPFWDRERMEYSTEFLIQVSQRARLFSFGVYPDRKIIDLVRNI
jgi:hypothetical protein